MGVIGKRGEMCLHISREAARPPSRVHPAVRIGEGFSRVTYDHVHSVAGSLVAEKVGVG